MSDKHSAATVNPPFDLLIGQKTAAQYLSAVADSPYLTQALLLSGPAGAGKTQAAILYSMVMLCLQKGTDNCENCRLVAEQKHPDLHIITPGGAAGYLAEQMQELFNDVSLAPVQSARKIYLITQAELMSGSFANAFLKTLEEPPPSVVFILITSSIEAVLPTIRSRCQVVPFVAIPDSETIAALADQMQVTRSKARLALAVSGGSITQARNYLLSPSLNQLRQKQIDCLRALADFDPLDVMDAARELVVACRLPLDDLRVDQERRLEEGRQALSRSAQNTLEQSLRREMTSAERNMVRWLIVALRVWLRDVLWMKLGLTDHLVNDDQIDLIRLHASRFTEINGLLICLEASSKAERGLDYNVSVQSIFEYLLFTLYDELKS
jgi:DNA polymerase-3 subunit delta'